MADIYKPTVYVNNNEPNIEADNLNKGENAIADLSARVNAIETDGGGAGGGEVTAASITDATDTGRKVLTAKDAAAARTAIGAGTGSSNLKIGTTATDAKAGDWKPAWADISGKPTIPDVSGLAKKSDLDAALARIKTLEDASAPAEGGE
ncbi:MAG: hypothetical protein L0K27_01670 [Corynebacterium nuruki]|jgi:hypothetical protein|nr:hypothetical protein [Corynebacterium nuruki]